jgi:hypothetical protein
MKNILLTLLICFIGYMQVSSQTQNTLSYDGNDDYADCGSDASLNITGNITIEAWIRPITFFFFYNRIVEKDWTNSYYFGSGQNNNTISFGMDPNANVNNIVETAPGVVTTGAWTHVAGSWDGSTLRIYVNGELSASKTWVNASVDGSPRTTKIGRWYNDTEDHYFEGNLDEIRIWSEARTINQIRDNMYRELPNPASEANLVAYYQFDEGIGQTIEDLSLNNNTAVRGATAAVETSDPAWVASTAPIPYYSVADGSWNTNATWAANQLAPTKDWARVIINDDVNVSSTETALEVVVSTTGNFTVNNGNTLDVTGDFTVKSDATGDGSFINNGTFTYGNATVERYYPGSEWHLISSPVSDAVSGLFTGLYLQNHDEATNVYSDIIPVNISLTPGTGYALWNSSTATAQFNGMLNEGAIGGVNNVTRSGAGNNYGWNLVGNPYCSSIDWDAASGWTKTNVNDAIYLHVNATTWATYISGAGVNGGSRYIAPGQGFFVNVAEGQTTGTFSMNDDVRVHNNTAFYKAGSSELVRLQISGNGYTDETIIRIAEDATNGFDSNYDAYKFFGNANFAAQIYSLTSDLLAINTLPEAQNTPLGIKVNTDGIFTISATEIIDFATVLLEDTETGDITDLITSPYTFNYLAGQNEDRFILHFSPLSVDETLNSNMNVFASNGIIYLNLKENINGNLAVYNIMGQLVYSSPVNSGMNTFRMEDRGTYIVKVTSDKMVVSHKVTIN